MKSNKLNSLIPEDREKITLGQLILAGCFILLSFSSCTLAISNKNLSEKRITNVQLSNGTAITVQQKEENYRDSRQIKEFTSQWLSLMFSWDGKLPGTDKPDPGVKTPNGKVVPVNSWGASLMMEPQFSQVFLDELSTLVPNGVFNGEVVSALVVRYLSQPKQVNSTTYEIRVIADRRLFNEAQQTEEIIPFNKIVTLRATVIPVSPLKENANTLEKTVYRMRASGLEITEIVNYEP